MDDGINYPKDTKTLYSLIVELKKRTDVIDETIGQLSASAVCEEEIFSSEIERDSYFLDFISVSSPLKTNKAIIVEINNVVQLEVWGGSDISDPSLYDSVNWVNPESLTLTAAQIKAMYESNGDTNALTDALLSKLNGIESGAEANPTAAEIATLYEGLVNTNKFTNDLKSKLEALKTFNEFIAILQAASAEKMKAGTAINNLDGQQSFLFDVPFTQGDASQIIVIVQPKNPNFGRELAVVSTTLTGFVVDRANNINEAVEFDYFAYNSFAVTPQP